MEKFNARGQVVFVEPKWVTGETCLFMLKGQITYYDALKKLSKLRKKFLTRLEETGFVITHDKINIDENVVCLTMNDRAICDYDKNVDFYKEQFDKRIFSAGGEKFNYPYTLTMEEYFKKPFFPAVFKNELANGGIDKFLIETMEQVEIIKKFYNDFSNSKEYNQAFRYSIFQQLIETPTKHKTYMRVLMSASGDVMGASLKYSKLEEEKRLPKGIFEKYFWCNNSEYFLGCNGMFNYYSQGGNISFCQPKYSSEKKEILELHGIDPNNPKVPDDVLEVASSIVSKCNRELGIICGIDFILNKHDNKWYYLENQAFPAVDEWADTKDIRMPKINNVNSYIDYFAIELDARYEALMLYTKKKLSSSKIKKRVLSKPEKNNTQED